MHNPTVAQGGGGVDGTPPLSFWYVVLFRNDFTFSGKPLIFLTRWVVALLEACDVTKNGRHLGGHFEFYQEFALLKIPRLKDSRF